MEHTKKDQKSCKITHVLSNVTIFFTNRHMFSNIYTNILFIDKNIPTLGNVWAKLIFTLHHNDRTTFGTLQGAHFLIQTINIFFRIFQKLRIIPLYFPYLVYSAATKDTRRIPTRHKHKVRDEGWPSSLPPRQSLYIPPDSHLRKNWFNLVEIPKNIRCHGIKSHSFHHLQAVAPILVWYTGIMHLSRKNRGCLPIPIKMSIPDLKRNFFLRHGIHWAK